MQTISQPVVRVSRHGKIAVVTIDNPPVNALSDTVRASLVQVLPELGEDPTVAAVVLTGQNGQFVAGADIREMSRPPAQPFLPEVVAAIDAMKKPILAAIDGAALGGGLELALACDLRVGTERSRVGLPETKLGVIPGAGGTQRLPRLTGVATALELIGSAKIISGKEALHLGILDALMPEDRMLTDVIALAENTPKRRLSDRDVPCASKTDVQDAEKRTLKRAKGATAVLEAVRVVKAAETEPFAQGLSLEREAFLRLRESEEAKALRYLFLAERATGRLPASEKVQPRHFSRIGIIGGGTMGAGIAVTTADAALNVVIIERDAAAVAACQKRIASLYAKQIETKRISEEEAERRFKKIQISHEWDALKNVDFVIEAAFESMEVKEDIFRSLNKVVQAHTVVATNTSYLDLDAIAGCAERPENVLGLHFFSPAHIMRLVEVIRGAKTAPDALATAIALGRKIQKLPVVAAVGEGFIGNRIFSHYRKHAEYLMEDGVSPQDIDQAMQSYGFAMGPFAVADLSGLDIAWAMRKRQSATRNPNERYVKIPDMFCEAGRLGRKTGKGWYSYTSASPELDDEACALIEAGRKQAGSRHVKLSAEAIQRRLLAVLANEGAKVLESGVASSASDIDIVFVNGYGFPRIQGGPMFAADKMGLPNVLREVEAAAAVGGAGSEPSALLIKLAQLGGSFTAGIT